PEIVLGVLNVHGAVIPAVNIRKRFNITEQEIGISDQLIIARTKRRMVALPVDAVLGVLEYPEELIVKAEQIVPHLDYVQGVLKLDDGLVLIHDLDTFLSLDEHLTLDEAMK
ncbi:MAG: chemotaxis protein CheW, partial [Bacteroidota bacterium]